jgi:DNA modification methylase
MSDIKCILGDFTEKVPMINDGTVDLIIADIPVGGDNCKNIDYGYIFKELSRVLNRKGVCVVTVDTFASSSAFFVFCWCASRYFQFFGLLTFVEEEGWGNAILLEHIGENHLIGDNRPIYLDNPSGEHPNSKDGKLYELFIERYSKEGDLVLDPFAGEMQTARISERMNRNYIGIEINPEYFYEKSLNC